MVSATINRPSAAMTNAVRSSRFPEFGAAPNRNNSDSSQSSTLGQTFGNGTAWQNTSGIWGNNAIGSGFSSKRDASRSRGKDDFPEGPSGSGALAASSEADPWSARSNGPWNPDNTSPTLQSQSGSTSPSHTRVTMQSSQQTLLEIQNKFQQQRPAIGQGSSFSRPQPKSNLDPSSGTFKFGRQPSFTSSYNDDKENSSQYNSPDTYDIDASHRYLPLGNSASRDPSAPPHSRGSDSVLNGGSMAFGNGNTQYGSIGGQHTPSTSSHSQRQSFSGPSGSYSVQGAGTRYDRPDMELSRKFAGVGLHETEQPTTSHVNNTSGTSYSQNSTNFTPQNNFVAGGPGMWGEGNETFNNYEAYSNQPFADQAYFGKAHRFTEKGSVSPAGSDYRRGGISPRYYSAAGTPPVGSEQIYRPSSQGQRVPQGPGDLEKRLQNIHFAQQHAFIYGPQFAGQYPYQAYDYPPSNYRQPAVPYGLPMPMPPYPTNQGGAIPTRPAKDQDVGMGVRSVLLEEFRSNTKASKKYDLKDIYNHIVEFSGDQHGSRFIQQKLETANSDEKEQLFREIQPNALQLMTDVFGNYVIQKLFEHGNQVQKRVLAEQMKNHVMELSLQMYGCRVVQKALEHVLLDQQAELVQELRADVIRCVKDQNGNHVVQKAIERLPTEHIEFIVDAFRGQVHILAAHSYGCRVIQRILEFCPARCHTQILEEFHQCSTMLITDQFGNYVTQHVISQGTPDDRAKVIRIVTAQLLTLSKHKFASNVVEKSIVNSTDEQRRAMAAKLTALNSDGSSPLQLMMKDQFGNYVIQKLLGQLKGDERESFVEDMKPQLLQLKKYNYGKQIAAIEKLIFTGPQHSYGAPPSAPSGPASRSMPIEINNTPTPMLTNGQNSPQSSSLPSTNVSTIDDTPEINKPIETDGKICPEVIINGI